MVNGIDAEKETLQSLVRSCLLELNKLKFDLTQLEVEKANDNSASRIRELEQDIVDKEKEVSVIKFKAEEEANQLRNQLNEKDLLIKNQEDRIYELDYVNNSLDEIKTYFAEQLKDYKKNELAEVNERLNESYKSIAEKDALEIYVDDDKIILKKYIPSLYSSLGVYLPLDFVAGFQLGTAHDAEALKHLHAGLIGIGFEDVGC